MSWTQVGTCPKCGAPIYAATAWFSILPPPNHYTCGCRGAQAPIVTGTDTNPRQMTRWQA